MKLRKGQKIKIGNTIAEIVTSSNTGLNILSTKNCTFKLDYLIILNFIK